MTRPAIARIALNRPLRRLFDYLIPDGLELAPGQRVTVPFGRQTLTGLVVEIGVEPPPGVNLKAIKGTLEAWPALPDNTFNLLTWASDYYQHPLGECLFTALPQPCDEAGPLRRKRMKAGIRRQQRPPYQPTHIGRSPCSMPSRNHLALAPARW